MSFYFIATYYRLMFFHYFSSGCLLNASIKFSCEKLYIVLFNYDFERVLGDISYY